MQIALQVIIIFLVVLATLQKKKWCMMMIFSISNLVYTAMYFSFGRTASAIICIVACVRTLTFMIFALMRLKPNVYVLLLFEIGFIVSTALTWQDPFDLLPLFALMIAGYASWQNNQFILRLGYVINPTLFFVYKTIIGAYIALIAEVFVLISSIFSFLYYCVLKKEKNLTDYLINFKRRKVMIKNIVIIHGIGGIEKEPYFPHLYDFCEGLGIDVYMPSLGGYKQGITYEIWKEYFDKNILQYIGKDTIIVAQSNGTQFSVKYLAERNLKINTYISLAGFKDIKFRPEEEEYCKKFEPTSVLFAPSEEEYKKFKKLKFKKYSLFSDNDTFFEEDNLRKYIKAIGSEEVYLKDKAHFNKENKVEELERLIEKIVIDSRKERKTEFKNYNDEVHFMINLVKKSAKIIEKTKVDVKDKGSDDIVTNCDLTVEKYIIKEINRVYPNVPIISEEFNSKEVLQDKCFTIDPIDGTINFANNIPYYAIQIAYRDEGETVACAVYMPKTKELFYAVKGEGAFLNGERIFVSRNPINKLLYTIDAGAKQPVTRMINDIIKTTKHYRRIGAAAISLSYTAKGAFGGTIFLSNNIWDIEPGLLLVTEACGKFIRTEKYLIAACNEKFLNTLSDVVKKYVE